MSGHPFKIYNASAGSGKTHTLTRQYLKIVLSRPHAFGAILAITFTNKAVNEMKRRILGSLYEFSTTKQPQEASMLFVDLMQELQLDCSTLRERAKRTLKDILHNYGFFDISTIDKFTHRLIRTFAKDLKLAQNFEVVLDTDLLLAEAIDNLLVKVGRDKALTKVLLDFALEKIEEDKSWDISFDLNKTGKMLFNETYAGHLALFKDKEINDFLALKKILESKIRRIESNSIALAKNVLDYILENGLDFSDFSRETLPNHFKKVVDKEFAPTRLYANKLLENLNENKVLKANAPNPEPTVIPYIRKHYLILKEYIYERAFLKNIFHQIVPLTVLNSIQKEVKEIQLEKGQLSISEFNTLISNEIKNQPAPFIYERLGEKYRHYFIDEFQDTSELQWNNLVPLIGNALEGQDNEGNPGSLFLVGDAKQAIYRWRGGKAEQFLNMINGREVPFVISPKIHDLPSNYRSHDELIKFNNDFFTVTSPLLSNPLYHSLFEKGNQQKSTSKTGGYVQLTFLEDEKDQNQDLRYCEEVLNTIQLVLAKAYAYSDMAILVRDNKHGIVLADFLSKNNIPVISPDSLLVSSSTKVQFLINLLHYSVNKDDLETSYQLLYHLAREQEDKHTYISGHLKNLSGHLKDDYGFDISSFEQGSVYDGLEKAIRQFDLIDTSDAYLTFLMDIVLEVEQKEGAGIFTFLSYWEKKKDKHSISAPDRMNAVQIMSVHKSKGLEFPIVIFPYANSHIYKEIDPKLWLSVNEQDFNGFNELLIGKKKEVLEYGTSAAEAFGEEHHKLELDAFNILYVALTRAEKALFIISQLDKESKTPDTITHYSHVFMHYLKERQLWDADKPTYTFGQLPQCAPKKTTDSSERNIPYQYSNKENPNFRIMAKAGLLWDTEKEAALSRGNMIHYLMGLIASEADVEQVFHTLQKNGAINETEGAALKKKIYDVVYHPELKQYFSKANDIRNEWDIITDTGEILRPDRIVIKDRQATIIDYKTGKENVKYKYQLNKYATALEAMGYTIENKIITYINNKVTTEYI